MSIIYIYLYMHYMLKRRVEQWVCLCVCLCVCVWRGTGTGIGRERQRKSSAIGEQRASFTRSCSYSRRGGGWVVIGFLLQLSSLSAAGFDSIRLSFNHFVYLYFIKQPFCCIVVVLDLLFIFLFFFFFLFRHLLYSPHFAWQQFLLLLLLLLSYIVITFQFQSYSL